MITKTTGQPFAKTDRMLLVEERAGGSDIREVLRNAYRIGGNAKRAAAWITKEFGVDVSEAVFTSWVRNTGGRRTLEFPTPDASANGHTPERAEGREVATS